MAFNSFEDETYILKVYKGESLFLSFNSFEDETKIELYNHAISFGKAFNSFEDETSEIFSQAENNPVDFQFLWGWNVLECQS